MLRLLGFALLRFQAAADPNPLAAAMRGRGIPVRTIDLIDEPAAVEAYAAPLVLVRPDVHVAWRGPAVDEPDVLADRVRGKELAHAD